MTVLGADLPGARLIRTFEHSAVAHLGDREDSRIQTLGYSCYRKVMRGILDPQC